MLNHHQSDICLLRLFESFLESAPQLLLQLYVIHELGSWQPWTGNINITSVIQFKCDVNDVPCCSDKCSGFPSLSVLGHHFLHQNNEKYKGRQGQNIFHWNVPASFLEDWNSTGQNDCTAHLCFSSSHLVYICNGNSLAGHDLVDRPPAYRPMLNGVGRARLQRGGWSYLLLLLL